MNNLSYDIALGSMSYILESARKGYLDPIGVSQAEFDRLVGPEPWLASERNTMASVIHSLMFSSLDALGLPRFPMPAEMLAATISMFVHGVNVQPACVFAVPSKPAELLSRSMDVDPCTPQQLFALVRMLYADSGRDVVRSLFEKKTGLRLSKALASSTPKA